VFVPLYAALAAAFVFFLVIPVIGAVSLRAQWRSFRNRVVELEKRPLLTYGDAARIIRGGDCGSFRLYGSIEAIEGSDRVWVRGEGVSALVDLSRAPVYTVPPDTSDPGSVKKVRWKSVSSVAEGTRVFVGGRIVAEAGRAVFVHTAEENLIVVIHDGDDAGLASRLIVGGRSVNEYFGYATPLSVALGLIAISIILLIARSSPFSSVRALIFLIGTVPVLPFAPPGLAFFLAYRWLWRRALRLRVERDMLRLSVQIPVGTAASMNRYDHGERERLAVETDRAAAITTAASGLCMALALAVNYALAFALWRMFM
jgi:hypothetical protein